MGVALASGFGLGFLVAAEVGPIWLLCVRTSVRFGFRTGAAVGMAAATVDTIYAALGVAGATALLTVDALRLALGLLGAAVLALIAARTLWSAFRVRNGGEAVEEVASPGRAYATAFLATASNPLTIATWAAIFSAVSVAGLPAVPLLVGVCAGSAAWFAILSGVSATLGRRASPGAVRTVDVLAGIGLAGFAGVLAVRTLRS